MGVDDTTTGALGCAAGEADDVEGLSNVKTLPSGALISIALLFARVGIVKFVLLGIGVLVWLGVCETWGAADGADGVCA